MRRCDHWPGSQWHPHNRGQTFTLNQGEGCMFTLAVFRSHRR